MFLLKTLKRLLGKQPFRSLPIEDRSQIREAFSYNGVKYFTFNDIFRMPTSRGLHALDYYDEFSMRCTRDYLTKVCAAFETILSDTKKLDLIRFATIVKNLKERLEMIPSSDHIFKLASVMFFDETENPYFYDREYAKKKIELWKKDPEVLNFFLREPLAGLIPFLDSQKTSLHSFSVGVEAINKMHLEQVLEVLSQQGTKVDM